MSEGKTVHQAISAVMAEMAGIGKDQVNRDQGYKFRGIDDVLKELHPLLAKHGVILAPDVVEREYEERVAKSGTVGHCAHLHVRYTVYGPNGDSIELSTWGQGLDYGDKETNKAMTMAFKYALFQLFAVADPADDADHDSPGESTTPTTARSTVRRTAGGEAPPCTQPGCSGHLVERKNRESGEAFVSCTNYKECHFRAVNGTMDQYLGMADAPPDDEPGQHPSDGATRGAQISALVNGMAQNDIRDAFKAAGASDCLAAVGSGWKIRGAEVARLSADVWAALVQALSGDVDPDEIPFP